jgi:hypothetical protein
MRINRVVACVISFASLAAVSTPASAKQYTVHATGRLLFKDSDGGAVHQLKDVLLALGFKDEEVQLEAASGGKVGGVVVSGRFSGQSQEDRQSALWAKLRAEMKPDELVSSRS